MPEGVEIRKFADITKSNVVGHSIVKINILRGRYTKKAFDNFNELQNMLPVMVNSVNTKGKFTYFEMVSKTSKCWLFNTLGLTGGWTVSASSKSDLVDVNHIKYMKSSREEYKKELKGSIFMYPVIWEYMSNNNSTEWFEKALDHLNVEFELDNGNKMYFYDQLSFGTLKVILDKKELEKKLKELGPDIMDKDTTFEIFKQQICKSVNKDKKIGNVIVNQKVLSGIGNYLRADALWMSNISPFRKVSEMTDKELEILYKSARALMWGDYNYEEAKKNGYINKDFKIPHDYNREFFVYRQETDLEGNKVVKEELYEGTQKRFIYWIPSKQK